MIDNPTQTDGVSRRTLLKAGTAGAGTLALGGTATASDNETIENGDEQDTRGPEGFETEVVAPHATFPDDVSAAFGVAYEEGADDSVFLHDALTAVIVKASLEPGGTSGWHGDKGPVIGSVVDGEIDVTFDTEDGCVTRTYAAGEALVATGEHPDVVENVSDTEPAMAYLVFLGVPAGESPSKPVEAPSC
jgi:quercetin dioxygenase-like cupin family protein